MTIGVRRASRPRVAALGMLLVTLIAGPGVAQAGTTPVPGVAGELGDPCISVAPVTPGATVKLTLRRSGEIVARDSVASQTGEVTSCLSAPLRGGDRLTMKQVKQSIILGTRTVELPRLTVRIDAATENTSVHAARASASMEGEEVVLGTVMRLGGLTLALRSTDPIALDSDGNADRDWSDDLVDITNGYSAYATWRSSANDVITATVALPFVAVQAGRSKVNGVVTPGARLKATLASAGGTVRGTMTGTGAFLPDGEFRGRFKNGTSFVAAAVGNKVTSTRLAGSWTVVSDTLAVTPGLGSGSATVTCPADVVAGIWLDDAYATPGGALAPPKHFTDGNVVFNELTITSGMKVRVVCQAANGFGQWFTRVVP